MKGVNGKVVGKILDRQPGGAASDWCLQLGFISAKDDDSRLDTLFLVTPICYGPVCC